MVIIVHKCSQNYRNNNKNLLRLEKKHKDVYLNFYNQTLRVTCCVITNKNEKRIWQKYGQGSIPCPFNQQILLVKRLTGRISFYLNPKNGYS